MTPGSLYLPDTCHKPRPFSHVLIERGITAAPDRKRRSRDDTTPLPLAGSSAGVCAARRGAVRHSNSRVAPQPSSRGVLSFWRGHPWSPNRRSGSRWFSLWCLPCGFRPSPTCWRRWERSGYSAAIPRVLSRHSIPPPGLFLPRKSCCGRGWTSSPGGRWNSAGSSGGRRSAIAPDIVWNPRLFRMLGLRLPVTIRAGSDPLSRAIATRIAASPRFRMGRVFEIRVTSEADLVTAVLLQDSATVCARVSMPAGPDSSAVARNLIDRLQDEFFRPKLGAT